MPRSTCPGLGELDAGVADDLDPVAPGIEKVEKRPGQHVDPGLRQGPADRLLVVDDEAEMPPVVGRLTAALLERQELVAQVDEGRILVPAAQGELEQPAVERQRFVDVADLERHVVEPDGARLFLAGHDTLLCVLLPARRAATCAIAGRR